MRKIDSLLLPVLLGKMAKDKAEISLSQNTFQDKSADFNHI